VLLLDPQPSFAVEATNFRLSSWDGGGPSGTISNLQHPAMSDFPSDGWCDLQFYPLIQNSKTILLTSLPVKVEPLIRCIDRPTRLADRAYLFEVSMGHGKLLVSGFNFGQAVKSGDPAGVFLFDRLVRYALGSDFNPKVSLPVKFIRTKGAK
jgi:beta-galactosidase